MYFRNVYFILLSIFIFNVFLTQSVEVDEDDEENIEICKYRCSEGNNSILIT